MAGQPWLRVLRLEVVRLEVVRLEVEGLEVEGERLEVEVERLEVEGERLEVEVEGLEELRGLRPLFHLSKLGGPRGLEVVFRRQVDGRPEESLEDTELEETWEDARLVVLMLEGPRPLLHHRKTLRSAARTTQWLSWPGNMGQSCMRVPRPRASQIRET